MDMLRHLFAVGLEIFDELFVSLDLLEHSAALNLVVPIGYQFLSAPRFPAEQRNSFVFPEFRWIDVCLPCLNLVNDGGEALHCSVWS